ncbi:MarR family winged helix-turn-helix transcriptional regulator [Candidatus Solirubrobacter pratensis]|uniref:MarR family winged helix-turn-helix transcriptional regulator n=1 Tax=Candidatus Solirubrobacter pratensis TaxID=1298857 RepID=UPI0009DB8F92|nr:MarR family winged helix-turn-helix transcriptional regulator [Candidatus Solirubrobacter pratensis]
MPCNRASCLEAAAAHVLRLEEVLAALSSGGPASQRELGERLRKDPADMVRLLDAASARGLVRRDADPADRRRRRVVLTRAGEAELEAAMTAAREVERELLAGLEESERRTLHELLSRLPR